jgi:lipid-A-disaccharide synthase
MRIFINTGEVSGDLQGALLVEALFRQAKLKNIELEILAVGSSRMAAAGAKLLGNTATIGSVGILESLPFLLPTFRLQQQVLQHLRQFPPDIVVLIDYMGPNLKMGRSLRHTFPNVPIIYYIAPQEWVWSLGGRGTTQIVKFTDQLLAIFPEEARYFQNKGANVTWVGHPLLDRMQIAPSRAQARQTLGISKDEMIVALIPASRWQEIRYLMPVMFQAAQELQAKYPKIKYLIPASLPVYQTAIEKAIKNYNLNAQLVTIDQLENHTLNVLAAADLAITKSGTVNLEIALLNVPQVVMYRVSPITAWMARYILKFSIPFMSPPNLVQMKSIVPEFLQDQATPKNIVTESIQLLQNIEIRQKMLENYQEMRQALGEVGVCDRAAIKILESIVK